MSDIVFGLAKKGTQVALGAAEGLVRDSIGSFGADREIQFPDTAFYLPLIYAVLGQEVKNLKEAEAIIKAARTMAKTAPDTADGALLNGVITAVCAEVIEAVKYFLRISWRRMERFHIGFHLEVPGAAAC
jgi:acetyl-CoA synthase